MFDIFLISSGKIFNLRILWEDNKISLKCLISVMSCSTFSEYI